MKSILKMTKKSLMVGAFPIAICASEAVTWWWTNPPAPAEGRKVLDYSFPFSSPDTELTEFPPNIFKTLNCTGASKGWINLDGEKRISVSYLEWDNIEDAGLNHALSHAPEVCMGSIGHEVEAFFPERRFTLEGKELVFDITQFSGDGGEPFFIFKLYWVEGIEGVNLLRSGPNSSETRQFKIQSAWNRSFPKHARVLMLGVHGVDDEKEAWQLIRENVLDDLSMVQPEK